MNGIGIHRSLVAIVLALTGWLWLPGHLAAEPPRRGSSVEPKAQSAAKKIDPATRTIAGRVFDARGRPLAGASVWLIRQDDWNFSLPESTVIAESQSRSDGRFDLMPLVADLSKHADDPTAEFEVWVWKRGFAVGHRSFYGEPIDQPISVFLGDDSPFELLLKTPEGLPCAGAIATPVVASFDYSRAIPKPLQDRLKAQSALDGHVEINGFGGRIKGVAIKTPEFGTQTLGLSDGVSSPLTVTLHNTRTIEGRFVSPKGDQVDVSTAIVHFEISSEKTFPCRNRAKDRSDPPRFGFWQEFSPKVDHEGRFRISGVLDHGLGDLHVKGSLDSPFPFVPSASPKSPQPDPPNGIVKLEIPLIRGIWCNVLIRDAQTKKALPGVDFAIATKRVADQEFDCDEAIVLPDSDRTDSQGRIRIRVRPGETYRARCVPFKGYVDWSANNSEVHIPAGVDRFDLPPIELARTCVIKGRLVDTDSRAIAGVRIRGSRCSFGEHEKKPAVEVDHWTTTDSSGSFQFDDLAAGTTVTLLPVRSAVALTELVSVVAGADKPIQLQAKKEQLVALTGRVVGADHNPIANARVAIEAANSPDPSAVLTLSLDANGLFQTPAQFPARFRYRLSVRSMLDNVASTEWICPACSGARFPDLIVDRERVAIDAPLTGKEIVGRVDNHPIYAEELLALYCTEPLSNARSLLLARKDLSDFRITKQEYRSLQDEAIKRHLADIVRVRVLTGALLAQLDAQERGRLEEVVAKEFQEYVEKLKGDFQVTSPNEVDHELKRQETSLAKLRTEFRYRLLARECLRLESPDSDAVWDEALAYYQAHRDAYATQQKVNWQLLEINFDMGRTVTAAVAIGAKARREQHGSHNDSKEAETPVKDSILSGTLLSGTQGKMDASRSESPPGAFQLGKLSIGSTFFSSIPPDPEKEVQKAEEKIGELLKSAAAFGEHISPEEARTLMDAALKELRQGKVFEDVAKKFSDGAMAKDGGWQPTTNPDSIVDEKTTDALRRLPEGATSAVIQTKHSLRIIRVVSRVPAGCQSFEEVQESIREHIRHAGQQKKVADIFSRTPIESAYPAEETSQSPLLSE